MTNPLQGIADLPEICRQYGVDNVVVSPGSRNAPLILSMIGHKQLKLYSITDERSAGYFALGISQMTCKPVALVCTSGTSVLNLYPAIAEAFYQHLPLIVLTADRPAAWIDQEDGQAIRQTNVFANHVKASFTLPEETADHTSLWHANQMVAIAMTTALNYPRGPVHLNIPLHEPLYNLLPAPGSPLKIIEHEILTDPKSIPKKAIKVWQEATKIMVVVGFNAPDERLEPVLEKLSADPRVVIIAENLSNMKSRLFFNQPDLLFSPVKPGNIEKYCPNLLITLGNSVVSKKMKLFLRNNKQAHHWQIGSNATHADTYQCLNMVVSADAASFMTLLAGLTPASGKTDSYQEIYISLNQSVNQLFSEFVAGAPYCDLTVFNTLLPRLPRDSILHLANSTPVRYTQFFSTRPDIDYYCNRGTSGIDGCISTAAGALQETRKPLTIIAGDIAFIYDSAALWNNYLNGRFRVIVINNNGGNIFRLIDTGEGLATILPYIETPHKVNIRVLAAAYGVNHYSCNCDETLEKTVTRFFSNEGPSVLEIRTDTDVNAKVFKMCFEKIKNSI